MDWTNWYVQQQLQNIWPTITGVNSPYRVMKRGKNGDRRHEDNPKLPYYRRAGDKMPPEELTKRILGLESMVLKSPKPGDVVKIESPKSLRRRVLEWLID